MYIDTDSSKRKRKFEPNKQLQQIGIVQILYSIKEIRMHSMTHYQNLSTFFFFLFFLFSFRFKFIYRLHHWIHRYLWDLYGSAVHKINSSQRTILPFNAILHIHYLNGKHFFIFFFSFFCQFRTFMIVMTPREKVEYEENVSYSFYTFDSPILECETRSEWCLNIHSMRQSVWRTMIN